jgi:hypothetical protein
MADRPLIQIDDEIRPMTDDEYARYLEIAGDAETPETEPR